MRSQDKHFTVGEKVLILSPDSTASKVYSRWKGPAEIVEVKSPYSYIVEYDGHRQFLHANKLRKFHVRVEEAIISSAHAEPLNSCPTVNTCAIIYDRDTDFGQIESFDPVTAELVPPSESLSLIHI